MAAPSVFVSSTFYDLKYVRENMRYFVETLGYTPVLSEEGAIFYDPHATTEDACLGEIPNCQLFILVIGGRFGSEFADSGASVTNAEYREAVRLRIPIFALVEQGAYADFQVFRTNRDAGTVDMAKLRFPHCDDPRVFTFIEEVQAQAVNNALVPFRDFRDMEAYLKRQWAGMMHSFLTRSNENQRVADTLVVMTEMNQRIEMLSEQILKSVGTDAALAVAEMYAQMLRSGCVHDLQLIGAKPLGPADILEHPTLDACAKAFGLRFEVEEIKKGVMISSTGAISEGILQLDRERYKRLRATLEGIASRYKVDISGIRAQQATFVADDSNASENLWTSPASDDTLSSKTGKSH